MLSRGKIWKWLAEEHTPFKQVMTSGQIKNSWIALLSKFSFTFFLGFAYFQYSLVILASVLDVKKTERDSSGNPLRYTRSYFRLVG